MLPTLTTKLFTAAIPDQEKFFWEQYMQLFAIYIINSLLNQDLVVAEG